MSSLLIPIGTPIPYPIVMNGVYLSLGPKPDITASILKAGTTNSLTPFPDIRIDYNYFDSTFALLLSIDVYGHDDGTGKFSEDTYLNLQVSTAPVTTNPLYLINQASLTTFEDISVNIKPERVLVFVKKMQDLDLKLFLGHAFYYDLIKYISTTVPGVIQFANNTPQQYMDLINGTTYADPHGYNIIYEGLIPTMVYFTFARFIEADAVRYTATGPVTKKHDNADPLKISDITKLVQQQRSVANAHANEVEKFLSDNKQKFPLWRPSYDNKNARQPGPRIRSIDRTKYNYPGGGNQSNYYGFNGLLNDLI